jgi:hypothetical protein
VGRQTHLGSVDSFTGDRRSGEPNLCRHLRVWSVSILQKIGPTGEISTQSRQMPQHQWRVVIPDHHPGYITWGQFLANRSRLAANRTNSEVLAGPAREGLCLLQGVLLCGICGRRLSTRYAGNGGLYPSYDCNSRSRDASPLRHCMSLPAKPLDDAIAARLLTAVTPLTIKLALEALTNLEVRDKAISAQWHRRIERARYDADLAERRYEEADPSNRLVASTLEKRWNDTMQRMIELKAEVADFERQAMRSLTPEQKQQILKLGKDFPRLWKAPTTSACDRKRMLRLLIRDITVVKGAEPKLLHLQICWQGGATETIDVHRRPNRAEAIRYPDTFVAKIRTMAEKYDDEEIVRRLNGEGLTSSTGKPFTVSIVRWIRFKHRIPGPSLPTGTLAVSQVRERYGVSLWVVHTGSSAALSQRCNANQTRHTPSRLTTLLIDVCENGWQAPGIFIHHPQRKLYEVYYAWCIGMPSSRSPPSGLGIVTRRTGLGRYVPRNSCSRIAGHAVRRWATVWSMSRPSTPAAPLLARTRCSARCRFSLVSAARSSPDPVLPGSCRGRRASSLPGSHAASPPPSSSRPACAGI